MRPFFPFFGSKWKLAARLGAPQREHVIEPFAGSAGYSVRREPRRVTLIEIDPVIAGLWRYLIRVSEREIMALPAKISHLDELSSRICQEPKWLIGFWLNHGLSAPGLSRSNWARQPRYAANFWSETRKSRIASQLKLIRHWTIIEGSYQEAPDIEAHWHVDPPYEVAGKSYRFNDIDRAALAQWCDSRRGFLQVCEHAGANWLPFEHLAYINNSGIRGRSSRCGLSVEAVYENDDDWR